MAIINLRMVQTFSWMLQPKRTQIKLNFFTKSALEGQQKVIRRYLPDLFFFFFWNYGSRFENKSPIINGNTICHITLTVFCKREPKNKKNYRTEIEITVVSSENNCLAWMWISLRKILNFDLTHFLKVNRFFLKRIDLHLANICQLFPSLSIWREFDGMYIISSSSIISNTICIDVNLTIFGDGRSV